MGVNGGVIGVSTIGTGIWSGVGAGQGIWAGVEIGQGICEGSRGGVTGIGIWEGEVVCCAGLFDPSAASLRTKGLGVAVGVDAEEGAPGGPPSRFFGTLGS